MSLYHDCTDSNIPHHALTDELSQRIKLDLGGYVERKHYLSKADVMKNLGSMGYHPHMASELADYVRECVKNAFERGVFVVSSRVIRFRGATPLTPGELVAVLKEREGIYFDPLLWYTLKDFKSALLARHYSHDIVSQLAPYILLHARAAFSRGINGAAGRLITH
jgi:hypothetical protein